MEMQNIFFSHAYGTHGQIKLEINLGTTAPIDLSRLRTELFTPIRKIQGAITEEIIKSDPSTPSKINENLKLLSCFPCMIYHEELPNGYCKDTCCKHLPWFRVTTHIGHFTIGWRKRVIHLEWTDTRNIIPSEELFSEEEVTKFDRVIHAWSLDQARNYVKKIITTTQQN